MELIQFVEQLKQRIDVEKGRTSIQSDMVTKTTQLIILVENCLSDLKDFVLQYKFRSLKEEIELFKIIKPALLGELFHFKQLFKISMTESYSTNEQKMKFYQVQLSRLETFASRNHEFNFYLLSKADDMDEQYFLRTRNSSRILNLDDRFSTGYDIKAARLLANTKTRDYLKGCISKIDGFNPKSVDPHLTWTGSKTDLIELIYALQAVGVFNKKDADVKRIAGYFELTFNISLGNFYRIYQDIRNRKTGQTSFLDRLKSTLQERLLSSDK